MSTSPKASLTFRSIMRQVVTFWRSGNGSFTLESSLVYPVVFLAIVSILFMSLFVYGQSSLYETASEAAERTAFSWDNSHKDWATGVVSPNAHDGLYWRTGKDALSGMFGFGSDGGTVRIDVAHAGNGSPDRAAPGAKLSRSAEMLPEGLQGSLSYHHGMIDRIVTVELRRFGSLPFLSGQWSDPWIRAQSKATVTEPVELIRNIDFIRTFVVRVKDTVTRTEAEQAIPAPVPQPRLAFSDSYEAAAYLRELVGGEQQRIVTSSGDVRILDALDADGLFHEVKYGYQSKTKDAENQIRKDLELLRSGTKVKGVVWHFFRSERTGKVGPSKPLRKELEKSGIIIVIHP